MEILYEDNHILVVTKPEGILSQKDNSNDLDLLTILKSYIKEKYNKPGEVYLGLVHRLDRRVGGVMVFAKTSKAASRISSDIRERKFMKTYLAIVDGKVSENKRLVDQLIKVNKEAKIVEEVENSQEAILSYEVIKNFVMDNNDFSLLKIDLETGRYNQIRVQLANNNTPIINDYKYGYKKKNYNDQLGLWCVEISFNHPTLKEVMTFRKEPTGGIWSK